MSITGARAHIVGFMDGYEGHPADATIIRSEYRKDYLEGWAAGRHKAEEDPRSVDVHDITEEDWRREHDMMD